MNPSVWSWSTRQTKFKIYTNEQVASGSIPIMLVPIIISAATTFPLSSIVNNNTSFAHFQQTHAKKFSSEGVGDSTTWAEYHPEALFFIHNDLVYSYFNWIFGYWLLVWLIPPFTKSLISLLHCEVCNCSMYYRLIWLAIQGVVWHTFSYCLLSIVKHFLYCYSFVTMWNSWKMAESKHNQYLTSVCDCHMIYVLSLWKPVLSPMTEVWFYHTNKKLDECTIKYHGHRQPE